MRFAGRSFWAMIAALVLIGAAIPLATLQAQQNDSVLISIAVPNQVYDTLGDQLLGEFASAHPGIKVNVIRYDTGIPQASAGVDAYFTGVQQYVSVADVVYIDPQRTPLVPQATRAGFFLDLAPLVNQDSALNVSDFFPAIWQSYQWDKGVWALPIASNAVIMSYDPAAFDKAGLSYPSEQWKLEDLINAAAKLGQVGADGKAANAAIAIAPASNDAALFRSLLGTGLFDSSAIPNAPRIDTPDVEAMLDKWSQQVDQAGLISNGFGESMPIAIGTASNVLFQRPNASGTTPTRVAMLLPGGKAALTTQAFAVSAGTQYPEQAYALASFLTTRIDVASRGSLTPARQSLVGAQSQPGGQGGGPGGGGFRRSITPENQAVIDKAIANGLPLSEMRYAEYLHIALQNMKTNATDAKTELQALEAQAITDTQAADARKQSSAVLVATPIPTPVLTAGKVSIKFALGSFPAPLPHADQWRNVIQNFVANDPQVGWVNLDSQPGFGGNISNFADNYDCFYLPDNAVPNTNLGVLMAIDPFLTADKTFDSSDVVGGVMAQLQRDNKTWAFPIIIEPGILKFNTEQFAHANVPAPTGSWSVDAFQQAVKALKPDAASAAPFVATNTNGTHLLILIAAYGGLPLDYRTNPPKVNFTDQSTMDAIQQVLDLAKQGYVKYDALGSLSRFGGARADSSVPIYSDTLNGFTFRVETTTNDPYKSVTYPTGSTYNGVSYNIGAAYISAKSQNPEGCYRWIAELSRHPDLFSAMPARSSLINDPALAGAAGPDVTALYSAMDKLLRDPNTLSFPSVFSGGSGIGGFLYQHWLYQAFDTYVLNNGDLAGALKDAEGYAKGFQQCIANLPPFDPATQNQRDYNQQYTACATTADPSMKSLFGG